MQPRIWFALYFLPKMRTDKISCQTRKEFAQKGTDSRSWNTVSQVVSQMFAAEVLHQIVPLISCNSFFLV